VQYINDQHEKYLQAELHPQRARHIDDTRVHGVIFFIAPTGHALKPIDIVVLKALSGIVNVVPVIAKSDSLTTEERLSFKKRIRDELAFNDIRLFPYDAEDDEPEEVKLHSEARELIPFAIVGSEQMANIGGKKVRARKNKWGTVNVEDPSHCEFVHLRDFLTRTHLQELIETTAHIHYEAFRTKRLATTEEI